MIKFYSKGLQYKQPFGAIKKHKPLFLKIEVEKDKPVKEAYFVVCQDEGSTMQIAGTCFQGEIHFHWFSENTGLYFYNFHVIYEDGTEELSATHQLTVYEEDAFEIPSWFKNGVMYQIFPDRFARNKDVPLPKQNKRYRWRETWGASPMRGPDEEGGVWNNDFFGGNLQGIIDNLPYLQDLGITVLYLNPIFEAFSNHRYDTGNYKKIDPMLGDEKTFTLLCQEALDRGIRIILDGVFNHTGSDSLYFNKNGRYDTVGAYQSKESPYADWYSFTHFPNQYDAWWGVDTLPAVNETTPSYLDYMLRDEDSVVKHWLKCGASGFRLDVADELTDEFLDELRIAVKSTKPDGVIIGEVWEDASNKIAYGKRRRYFQGKQLDSVMNYPLKEAIIPYVLGNEDGLTMDHTILSLWENYPERNFYANMNILGTHDTYRILTVLSEDEEPDEKTYQRLFLVLLLWAFMPGIPCIYYGDEIGMTGKGDPFNRGCFDFSQKNPTIFNFYKRLLSFRKSIGPMDHLYFSPEFAEKKSYGFSRNGEKNRVIILTNMGEKPVSVQIESFHCKKLCDFFSCGTVAFDGIGEFTINKESGLVLYLEG
ncbi:MAG: glycoside hydrolase family 13 protein [Anaerovorax sp.]